jgi:hypothetical protein
LLRGLAMTLDPANSASAGIPGTVLRSMRPSDAPNADESVRRAHTARKFSATLLHGDRIPPQAADINLTTADTGGREGRVAIPLSAEHVHGWLEKAVRGMLHFHGGIFVERSHVIEFMPFLTCTALAGVESEMAGLGMTYVNGPGIAVRMGIAEEDGVTSVFVFALWGQIYMGAGVQPTDARSDLLTP